MSASASHARDARIEFTPRGAERYHVDGKAARRQLGWCSVTEYLDRFSEPFDADATIERYYARWQGEEEEEDGGTREPHPIYGGMSREAIRALWEAKGDEACELGTRMHARIEAFYKQEGGGEDEEEAEEAQEGDEVVWEQFLRFHARYQRVLVPHRAEWALFDETLGLVGCLDMLYRRKDGTYLLCDWKRVRELRLGKAPLDRRLRPPLEHMPDTKYSRFCLQLNLYRLLLQRNYGVCVTRLWLVVFHPTHRDWRCYDVPLLPREMDLLADDLQRINFLTHAR